MGRVAEKGGAAKTAWASHLDVDILLCKPAFLISTPNQGSRTALRLEGTSVGGQDVPSTAWVVSQLILGSNVDGWPLDLSAISHW